MYIDNEVITFTGIMVLLILGVFVGLPYAMYRIDKYTCYTKYQSYNPEYVGALTGCMVDFKGKRVSVDKVQFLEGDI